MDFDVFYFEGFFKIAFASRDRWLQLDRPDYDFCKSILFLIISWVFFSRSAVFVWFL